MLDAASGLKRAVRRQCLDVSSNDFRALRAIFSALRNTGRAKRNSQSIPHPATTSLDSQGMTLSQCLKVTGDVINSGNTEHCFHSYSTTNPSTSRCRSDPANVGNDRCRARRASRRRFPDELHLDYFTEVYLR